MEMLENPLKTYFLEIQDDGVQLGFHCVADDPEHAAEQAYDAYPGCEVLSCRAGDMSPYGWQYQLVRDDAVYWQDPAGKASGEYRIQEIETGRVYDASCHVTLARPGEDGEARLARPAELSLARETRTLELKITVRYDPAGQTDKELAATLYQAADHLFYEGMLSWNSEATMLDMQVAVKDCS